MSKIKFWKILIFSAFLSSCSTGSIYSELFDTLKILTSAPKDIELAEVQKIPFSTMQARVGNIENSLVVLEEIQGDIYKWTSSNFIKIYTKNGYVVGLRGFDNELELIELDNNHPAVNLNFNQGNKTFTSFYTFNNPKLFRLPIKTSFIFLKEEKIKIFNKEYSTKKYEEKSDMNLLNWKFRNYFWINEENEILKSEQYFTPKNPKIYLLNTSKQ